MPANNARMTKSQWEMVMAKRYLLSHRRFLFVVLVWTLCVPCCGDGTRENDLSPEVTTSDVNEVGPSLDAVSDAPAGLCSRCHGDAETAAPPRDTAGHQETTERAVGAHRSHLAPSDWHNTITCEQCHRVPTDVLDVGHVDSRLPAELTWGDLASAQGAEPVWNGATCEATYCHGATLQPGGQSTVPNWTAVDGSQSACGSCHGIPPGGGHPIVSQCSACHPGLDSNFEFVNPSLHINGILDIAPGDCNACHGNADSTAPPQDTAGNTATSAVGVGAHRSHLGAADWHRQVVCEDCHLVPENLFDAGHIDTDRPAELNFGAVASADGTVPGFDGARCYAVYCHGATLLPGGSNSAPMWTTVDGTQAACGSCHSLPPLGDHPANANCEACHGAVVGANNTFNDASLHIDGVVEVTSGHPTDWATPDQHGASFDNNGPGACTACHGAALDGGFSGVSCDSCHSASSPNWTTDCTFCHGGSDNQTGAPPFGVSGETAPTGLHVGAHSAHVEDTAMHKSFPCEACHLTPTDVFSRSHIDGGGVAEVTFSEADETHEGVYVNGTCSRLYCHGNGRSDNGTAQWTDDSALDCSSCHTIGNMSGQHFLHVQGGVGCADCHADTVSNNTTISKLKNHINGSIQVTVTTWDGQGCSPACHESEIW